MIHDSISFAGDAELARCVDDACNRFVTAWSSGVRPKIEDFLTLVPAHGRTLLFQELLHEDLRFKRKCDEAPSNAEYLLRFPEFRDIILQVSASEPAEQQDSTVTFHCNLEASTLREGSTVARVGNFIDKCPPGYEIESELGQGGMGIVYLARQLSAGRLVALKIIRPEKLEARSALRQEALARFRREALASARLQHDHLVTVYDVGEWQGNPYYAMRYVPGCSLKEHLQQGPLSDQEAAKLLVHVARAVHVAHQAGVLHRDLKPHNILLEFESQCPLVTDFGLAKLLEGDDQLTVSGEVFGSPPYMAPEQALDANRATAATDVYGLGATLYHMLTGRPPFQASSVPETLRQVLDVEPVSPQQLNRQISRDMETICLKCLAKEPARRYASAADLAADLERFLENRPIVARPVSAFGKVSRWALRNPWVAGLLAALFLSLSLGLAGVIVQWQRANHNFSQAQTNLDLARTRLSQAQDVVKEFLIQVGANDLRDIPQMEPLRKSLMEKAVDFFEEFSQHASEDPALQRDNAIARLQLGNVYKWLGENEKSRAAFEESVARLKAILAKDAGDAGCLDALCVGYAELGGLHLRAGRMVEAEENFQANLEIDLQRSADAPETLESLGGAYNNLATLYREQGRLTRALEAYERATEPTLKLLEISDRADTATSLMVAIAYNQALVLNDLGRVSEARATAEQALSYLDRWNAVEPKSTLRRQMLANVLQTLSWFDNTPGKPELALEYLERAVSVMNELIGEHPDIPAYRFELARLNCSLGFKQGQLQQYAESRSSLDQAIALLEPLHSDNPSVTEYGGQLGEAYVSRGWQQQATADEQAPITYQRAIKLLTSALESAPNNVQYQLSLSQAHHELGLWYQVRDQALSRENYQHAVQIREKLAAKSPRALDGLAWSAKNLSFVLLEQGEFDRAVERMRQALAARRSIAGSDSAHASSMTLGKECVDAAIVYCASGKLDEAREAIHEATVIAGSLVDRELSNNGEQANSSVGNTFASWVRLEAELTTIGSSGSHAAGLRIVNDALAKLEPQTGSTKESQSRYGTARALLRQRRAELVSLYLKRHDESLADIGLSRSDVTGDLSLLLDLTEDTIRARQGNYRDAITRALDRAPSDKLKQDVVRMQLARVCMIAYSGQGDSSSSALESDLIDKCRTLAIEQVRAVQARDPWLVKRHLSYDPEFAVLGPEILTAQSRPPKN